MRNEEVTVKPWERQWNRVTHGETVRVERSASKELKKHLQMPLKKGIPSKKKWKKKKKIAVNIWSTDSLFFTLSHLGGH